MCNHYTPAAPAAKHDHSRMHMRSGNSAERFSCNFQTTCKRQQVAALHEKFIRRRSRLRLRLVATCAATDTPLLATATLPSEWLQPQRWRYAKEHSPRLGRATAVSRPFLLAGDTSHTTDPAANIHFSDRTSPTRRRTTPLTPCCEYSILRPDFTNKTPDD